MEMATVLPSSSLSRALLDDRLIVSQRMTVVIQQAYTSQIHWNGYHCHTKKVIEADSLFDIIPF